MANKEKQRVIFIGLACVDILYRLDCFPQEEGDHGAESMRYCVGGNAANSAQVFCKLLNWKKNQPNQNFCNQYQVEFVGTVGGGLFSRWLEEFLISKNIILHVDRYPDLICPIATVINNTSNNTRSFVAYTENLPEPSHEKMISCNLLSANFIHFQGRITNLDAIRETIRFIRKNDPQRKVKISMEFERESAQLNQFFAEDIDYYFVGKQFAPVNNWLTIDEALSGASKMITNCAFLISIWGTNGSKVVKVINGKIVENTLTTSKCYPPKKVIDTNAAGDTYLAAFLFDIIVNANSVDKAIKFASKIAGIKVGMEGYEELDQCKDLEM